MAYQLAATPGGVTIYWIGDGVGQLSVPGAQKLTVAATPGSIGPSSLVITVPGGDAPTAANIQTACTNLGTALGTLLSNTANLALIQGWASGKP